MPRVYDAEERYNIEKRYVPYGVHFISINVDGVKRYWVAKKGLLYLHKDWWSDDYRGPSMDDEILDFYLCGYRDDIHTYADVVKKFGLDNQKLIVYRYYLNQNVVEVDKMYIIKETEKRFCLHSTTSNEIEWYYKQDVFSDELYYGNEMFAFENTLENAEKFKNLLISYVLGNIEFDKKSIEATYTIPPRDFWIRQLETDKKRLEEYKKIIIKPKY